MEVSAYQSLSIVTGGVAESTFGKTPANVPAEYWATPDQSGTTANKNNNNNKTHSKGGMSSPEEQGSANKRKRTSTSGIPTTKRSKGKAAALASDVAASTTSPAIPKLPARERKTRQSRPKVASSRPIPHSLEECTEEDRKLLQMRDEGSDWKPIRIEWKRLTGEATAVSTLPNRYTRLKSNFTVIREEDNGKLIIAKRQVDESFETQKWDMVAQLLKKSGGGDYPGIVLKRQYKKMMVGSGVEPPEGVHDPDWHIPELGSEDERIGREKKVPPVQEEAEVDEEGT